MKKKILCLAITLIMVVGASLTVHAEDYKGSNEWLVKFNGEEIESNFASEELADDMMFIAAAVMLVCYFICSIFTGAFKPETEKSPQGKFIFFALLCGLLSCLYNRLNIFLAGKMASSQLIQLSVALDNQRLKLNRKKKDN